MRLQIRGFLRRTAIGLIGMLSCVANHVQALPSSGQITNGSGVIEAQNGQMVIQQNSSHLITQWGEFSIAAGERVMLLQPSGNSVCLARVIGGKPSEIFGSLTANGKLFLVNSNGILFGKGSYVNTGGLVATTMQMSDQDFMADRYRFSGGSAGIVNQGLLQAIDGGYVILLAPAVENQGEINAPNGNVSLGAGGQVVLALEDNGLIQVKVDSADVAARVKNTGKITANGGVVLLSAQGGNDLLAGSVNHQGIIEAKRLNGQGGTILLDSGEHGSTVVSGTLDASSASAQDIGGEVRVIGNHVLLNSGTQIDTSGLLGGTILVGGNRQGRGPEQNAQQTVVERGAVLMADGHDHGDGGNVVIWSNGSTNYQGAISARGGDFGGNGGQVEVSGKEKLSYLGSVDLRAIQGKTGELLLDPKNIYIKASGSAVTGDVSFLDNNGGNTEITGTALGNALDTASVRLQADNDIQFLDNVTSTSNNTLNVESGRSIIFDNNSKVSLQGDAVFKINSEAAQAGNRDIGSAVFKMWNGELSTNRSDHVGRIQISTGTFAGQADGTVELKSGSKIINGNGNIEISTISKNQNAITVSGGSVLQTTNGILSLDGTVGMDSVTSDGVRGVLIGGTLAATNGELKLKGVSNSTLQQNNNGVELDGAVLTGTGSVITLEGTGGNGNGDKNVGVLVSGTSKISSDKKVTITGTARAHGVSGHGVLFDNGSQVTTTGTGTINVIGNGSAGLNNNYGIQVKGSSAISSVDGNISLTGIGGASSGDFNPGIALTDSALLAASGTGSIILAGTGGNARNENSGVYIKNSGLNVNSGTMQVSGTGAGTGQNNVGIWLEQNVDLKANSQGAIQLVAAGSANASNSPGLMMQDLNLTGAGALCIEAEGGGASSKDMINNGVLKSVADISISGKGGVLHGAALGQVQAGGLLTLAFDAMPAATQLYGAGGVVLKPYTSGSAISVGGGSGGLMLQQLDLDLLTLGAGKVLQLGSPQTGTIKVNSQINQGSRNVTLQTGTNIELNLPIVTSGSLVLEGTAGANIFSIGSGQIAGMGSLTIKGDGGADQLVVNDSANAFDSSYQLSAAAVQSSSNGQQVNIDYQGLMSVNVRAGVGRVNVVNSKLLPGIEQVLSGGNSNASTLYVDCQGGAPIITATQIQSTGFGTILYDGFKTVVLMNVAPTPAPAPTQAQFSDKKLTDGLVLHRIEYPNRKFNEVDEKPLQEKQLRYVLKKGEANTEEQNNDVEIIIVNEGIAVP